jgi:hypothetical protein
MPKIFALRDRLFEVQNSLLCNHEELDHGVGVGGGGGGIRKQQKSEISTRGCEAEEDGRGFFGLLSRLGDGRLDLEVAAAAVKVVTPEVVVQEDVVCVEEVFAVDPIGDGKGKKRQFANGATLVFWPRKMM